MLPSELYCSSSQTLLGTLITPGGSKERGPEEGKESQVLISPQTDRTSSCLHGTLLLLRFCSLGQSETETCQGAGSTEIKG